MGTGQLRRIMETTPLPRNWQSFLQVDSNKKELFNFLADHIRKETPRDGKELRSTFDTNVKFTRVNKDTTKLEPFTHEEADTRIMIHVADCVAQRYRKVTIGTLDPDAVVLAVSVVITIGYLRAVERLWYREDFPIHRGSQNCIKSWAVQGSRSPAIPQLDWVWHCRILQGTGKNVLIRMKNVRATDKIPSDSYCSTGPRILVSQTVYPSPRPRWPIFHRSCQSTVHFKIAHAQVA